MDFLSSIFPTILVLISFGTISWIIYMALFVPTQWYTPIDKCIIITGCDSGIGFEMAKYLHSKGSIIIATVVSMTSFGAEQLQQIANNRIYLVEMDIMKINDSSDKSVDNIRKILDENKYELHALINNAGICVYSEFDFQTFDQINDQIKVNFMGPINLTKHLLPYIISSKGRLINISSVNAKVPFHSLSIYSATKKAIEIFTECLTYELDKFNVKTVCLRLGDFAKHTNIMANHQKIMEEQLKMFDEHKRKLYPNNYFKKYHESIMKKYGKFSPETIESSTLFQSIDEAVYAVNPSKYMTSAIPKYKLILFVLYYLPISIRCWVFNLINRKSIGI